MGKTAILSLRITSSADNKGFKKAINNVRGLERAIGGSDSKLRQWGSTVASLAGKASLLTVGVGGLAGPLAATATAAARALAPIAALGVAMAPAALGAGAAAIGTLKAAVSGLGPAMSAADPAAFAAAIADLGPATQQAATSLYGLKQSFADVGSEIQENFWSSLANIGDLGVLIAPVRDALTSLATDMGTAASGLVNFVSHGTGLAAMQSLISNSATAAGSLSFAFADVLRGIIAVGGAAAPIFADLAAKAAELAATWADRMTAAFADGSLTAYFNNAISLAGQLGTVFGQVGGIISGVWAALNAAGSPFLGTLGAAIAATDQWVNSAQGMSVLTSLFSSLSAAVAAVMPIIGQLATIIGGTLAPVLAQVITAIAPAVSAIVTAFSGLLSAVAPLVPIVAQFAAIFGQVLAAALTAITPVISQIAQILMTGLQAALTAIQPLMPVIAAAFVQLAAAVQPLMPAFQSLVQAVVGLIPPLVQVASAVIPALVSVIAALMPVIVAVIQGVANFVSSLTPLISIVGAVLAPVLRLLATVLGWVAEKIAPVIQLAVSLGLGLGGLFGAVGRVTGALGKCAEWVFSLGGKFSGLEARVATVAGKLSNVQGMFSGVAGAIANVVGWVANLIGKLSMIRWPAPPKWLSGMFEPPEMMPPIAPGGPVYGGMLRAGISDAPGVIASASRAASSPGPTVVNINVEGALDPRAVADQIRSVLRDDARTRGLTSAGGGVGVWA
nr:MAG TPA: tail tape measure [Caudoviricetes sp.]